MSGEGDGIRRDSAHKSLDHSGIFHHTLTAHGFQVGIHIHGISGKADFLTGAVEGHVSLGVAGSENAFHIQSP